MLPQTRSAGPFPGFSDLFEPRSRQMYAACFPHLCGFISGRSNMPAGQKPAGISPFYPTCERPRSHLEADTAPEKPPDSVIQGIGVVHEEIIGVLVHEVIDGHEQLGGADADVLQTIGQSDVL